MCDHKIDVMSGDNRINQAPGRHEIALGRQRTLSSMGAQLGLTENDVARLKITDFFVSHPFVVHFFVMAVAVLVTVFNPVCHTSFE